MDIKHTAEEIAEILKNDFEEKGVDLSVSVPGCIVKADAEMLKQVLINLLLNSLSASEKGTKVNLSVDRASGTCSIEVADKGTGINPALLPDIFKPYVSGDTGGHGLGLSVVLGIVKSFNGQIKIYSEPGEGTAVDIYFPRIETEMDRSKGKTESPIPTGNERILVVDDEKPILDMTKSLLEGLGYEVLEFISSQEALAAFKRNPDKFDLVITDMTMPQMTGLEMIKQMFVVRPKMPVILCTGFSAVITREKALALGIKGFLTKPPFIAS